MNFGFNGNNRGGFQSGGGFNSRGGFNNNSNPNQQGGYNSSNRGVSSNYRGSNPRGSRGRGGRGRGRNGGGPSGGGIKFANDVAKFDRAVDAHILPNRKGILCTAVWPEGNMVFSGGADGIVKMFDVVQGSSNEQAEGTQVSSLCSFGSWLFCGFVNQPVPGQDVGFVKGYNFGTGSAPEQFNFEMSKEYPAAHTIRVNTICVGADMVFTGGADGCVRAWSLQGAQGWGLVGSLGGTIAHPCPVTRMTVFNNILFTGAQNGEVKVWSMQGQLQSQFQAHEGAITDMLGWTNGTQVVLFTCSDDCTIRVWDLQQNSGVIPTGTQPIFTYPPDLSKQRKPKQITSMVTHVMSNQNHVLLVGFGEGTIQALDIPDFTDLGYLSGHARNNAITSLTTIPGQSLLFAGSMDGKLNCFTLL